jgi:dihydropteroate synthase
MCAQGADWIDVGGESTRPGAEPVSAAEELARVLPVLEALRGRARVPISIDTYKAEVAAAALAAGAEIVNDISGGRLDPELLPVVARARAAVVIGHMRGTPARMQEEIQFRDVVAEVADELAERVAAATRLGIERILCDPGIGFGKTSAHNLALLRALGTLRARLGRPIFVGLSRKRFLGELSGIAAPDARLAPSVVAAGFAATHGGDFIRAHDVPETRQAIVVARALVDRGGRD